MIPDNESTATETEAPDKELIEYLGGSVEEAPTPPAPSDATAPPPATEPEAQPRDATGRFASKDAPAAPPSEVAPAPFVAPATDAAPTPAPEKPFSYRAYNADYPIAGAVERADGVFFPGETAATLRQILAQGHGAQSRLDRQRAEYEAKIAQATQAVDGRVAKADAVLTRLARLRQDGKLQEWFEDTDRNWAILEAQAEADALKAQLAARDQEAQQRSAADEETQEAAAAEELRPQLRSHLDEAVRQMVTQEEFKGLDPVAMTGRLWESFFDRIFREAEQDYPQYGIRQGEIVIDYDAIARELKYEAGLRKPVTPAVTPAAVPEKPKAVPPPVASAKGAGGSKAPKKVPEFKNTKEVDAWFESGGYAELGE